MQVGEKKLIIKENKVRYDSNREFKDGMFRLLFSEKRTALELLNALEETSRTGEEKIEIDTLKQYAQFVDRVRNHMKWDRMDRDEAIRETVISCIRDGILEEFLRKHGSEVSNMLTDITWEEFVNIRVEEAEERMAWEKDRQFVTKLLRKNWEIDKIQELTEVPIDKILEIKSAIGV